MTEKTTTKTMTTEEFDEYFDNGGDVTPYIPEDSIEHVHEDRDTKRVNVDFPAWVVSELDDQAGRLGVTRQSVIKVWIAERIQAEKEKETA